MDEKVKFIGKIQSQLKTIEECPLQEKENAPDAYLEIYASYVEGVKDIVIGDKLVILTWLHLADRKILNCYRRNDIHGKKVGVFSTRSPDRPNPIGIHQVTVTEILSPGLIKVIPLEVLDGTPIVDIKPVIK